MTEHRMLHSDAFAWYMEKDPVLRSTVVAITALEGEPDWDLLRTRIDRLTRLVPRLRMRVQAPLLRLGPPRWTVDERFDLDYHLRRSRVADGGDWTDVLEFARTAAMDDFDRSRPLWEFTLLTGLRDGSAAFVTKLHHSLSDGIGGVQLAAMVIDGGPNPEPTGPMPPEPRGHRLNAVTLLAHSLTDDAAEAAIAAGWALRSVPRHLVRTLRNPIAEARENIAQTFSVGRFVKPVTRQASHVLGPRDMTRLLATLDISLGELSDAAHAAGCHLNDAYMAAIVEGVRRYHERREEALPELRVTVPVSVRRSHDPVGGNRITLVRIMVRGDVFDPVERMQHISQVMKKWRHEPALNHTQEIALGLNLLPRAYLGGIFKRIEVLASDVPGIPQPVWLAGTRITGYYGFGPTIGAGLNATLMSYAGTCNIGINIDTSAVDNPEEMLECLRQGFADVLSVLTRTTADVDVPAQPIEQEESAAT